MLKSYGKQGWWPVTISGKSVYGLCAPRDDKEISEIMAGAILTQNTAWSNVEKALDSLINANALDVKKIAQMPLSRLEKLIKSSGFYKQKALRLKQWFLLP